MVMQCDENWAAIVAEDIQIQALTAELKKAEAEDWWRRCVKKRGLATMSDILMIVSVTVWTERVSLNNSASDWTTSSQQHCTCTTSTPCD